MKKLLNKKVAFDREICERLENVQIEHNDAVKVIESRDAPDAFHYVDPPYFNSCQSFYSGYTETDFENLLKTLSKVKGKFLLSSYPSEILEDHTKKNGWHSREFNKPLFAKKGVAGKARGRKVEVLTANYPI